MIRFTDPPQRESHWITEQLLRISRTIVLEKLTDINLDPKLLTLHNTGIDKYTRTYGVTI